MGDLLNPDFQDFIKCFNKHKVRYVLVGGYAVIYHGYNRSTGDLDIFVEATVANYNRIVQAFEEFKMPVFDMTQSTFLNTESYEVFTFGVPPVSIDIITVLRGVTFDEAFTMSTNGLIDGIRIRVLLKNGLLLAKKLSNRPKDLEDIHQLILQEEE